MAIPYSMPPTSFTVLKKCINDRTARIGTVGLGSAGLRLSLLFAAGGFVVDGFDLDVAGAESPHARQSYLHSLVAEQIWRNGGRFQFCDDLAKLSETDIVIICVPTTFDADQRADLQPIREAAFDIASNLHSGHLVVVESISYPGATEEVVVPILENANGSHLSVSRDTAASSDIFVGISPERTGQSPTGNGLREISKVVSGLDRFSSELTADLYGKVFKRVVRVSSLLAAELTKLVESTYQCVNIALMNELKQACLPMRIDPWEVIAAARTKPLAHAGFLPGPGVGGRHIPFDCFSLSRTASRWGFRTKLIELAGEINWDMPRCIVRSVGETLNGSGRAIRGAKILVLGLAYERDLDDMYESPSLLIIELLRWAGARVDYNDPFVPYVGRGRTSDLNMTSTPLDDLSRYDAVLIATDHSSYDYATIVSQAKLVIDTRNATRGLKGENIFRC